MDYYNKISDTYLKALKQNHRTVHFKMEILDFYENPIGEIINIISKDNAGTIQIQRGQGCRRSCSFTIIDKEHQYSKNTDNYFWYNRKFKIYIGIKSYDDIYWFSQGVFVAKSTNIQGCNITVEGIDKFGFFNGELKTGMAMLETQIFTTVENNNGILLKNKIKVGDMIRETLSLSIGNGMPLDPKEPIIDSKFEDLYIYADITISQGGYIGEIFEKIATMFNAFVYYDVNGRFRMENVFNSNVSSYYQYLAPIYHFNDANLSYNQTTLARDFTGYNIVTVASDDTDSKIYSYTAKNNNPQSDVCISSIGKRGYEGGVVYITITHGDDVSGEEQCRQYAEYLLYQSVCTNLNVSFSYPILPHLDVDNNVSITNEKYGFYNQLFLIESLTMPIGLGDMTISVVNLQQLPTTLDLD